MSPINALILIVLPLPIACIMDILIGDPAWIYHPIRFVGATISAFERVLRRAFPATQTGERRAGIVLAIAVPLLFTALSGLILWLCRMVSPWLWFAVETIACWQLLAAGSLRAESMAVHDRLVSGDLDGARVMVGRIVGRDTDTLDEAGIARATVETIAENTSDGVVAPMLFMALGGAPLGYLYKSINTLDSMVGYKNDRYINLGRASALLDDAVNYLPARISARFMILAAGVSGFDAATAARVYIRDRANHTSPNSAHTEAVTAGAMGLRLGGDSVYFGKVVPKPTIGDDTRPIEPEDIDGANRLMVATSLVCLAACCLFRVAAALVVSVL